jgi:hypothetical protein
MIKSFWKSAVPIGRRELQRDATVSASQEWIGKLPQFSHDYGRSKYLYSSSGQGAFLDQKTGR